MKLTSFKKYLEEQEHDDTKHIIQTGLNSKGIMNDVTKDILNSRLAMATDSPFLTPYIALGSVARVVAYANIILPQYVFMDRDEGEVVFDATQFGEIAGINIDGSPARPNVDHYIYFSYAMNDNGYFDCFAALVDSDELEQIMDMGGDDSVDHVHNDQKVNEESDYFAGVRPSLDVFTHTDEKGTKHFLSFHKNGDITYHHKTSDGKTGNTHSKMNPLYSKSSKDHFHNATHDFFRYVSKEKVDEELKGNQHKLDVAEPKGKLTSADFKKLRGEEVDEGFDKWRNKLKKRNLLRKLGYEKSSLDIGAGNTIAMAVRAGRDNLKKKEAQQKEEAETEGQRTLAARTGAVTRKRNSENDKTPENAKAVSFDDDKMKYHNPFINGLLNNNPFINHAMKHYDSLSDAEKQKDREIVTTVAANMPTKKK